MAADNQKFLANAAILKMVYKSQSTGGGIHRNTLKKQLLASGKISSKTKITPLIEGLIALGKLRIDKEIVSLEPSQLQVGSLQKENDNFYIVTPSSKKRFPISKGVASGYKPGDILDIIIDYQNGKPEVIIMGKSRKEFIQNSTTHKEFTAKDQKPTPVKDEKDGYLLGRVTKTSHDDLIFIPNNRNLPTRRIPILNEKHELPSFQDKICAMQLLNPEAPLLGGQIVEVYKTAGNPMHEIEAIVKFYFADIDWNSPELQAIIKKIPQEVDLNSLDLISEQEAEFSQKGKTVDHTNLVFKTIDPDGCLDMDDAITTTFDEHGNYVVYTAVSNITQYLDLYGPLGDIYLRLLFTLYTVNRAYGITPPELSTGACSLNENENKLALVVKTIIDKDTGEIQSCNIYDSVVRSRKKYKYEDAQAIIDSLKDKITVNDLKRKIQANEELSMDEEVLLDFYASETIRKSFEKRKMLKLSSNDERQIILNDDLSQVVDIISKAAIPSQKLIEYFMLTANISAAQYAIDNNIDIIYRIHEPPGISKVDKLNEYFQLFNIGTFDDFSPQTINMILELVKGTPLEEPANEFIKMQQSRAKYSVEPGQHFGIGLKGPTSINQESFTHKDNAAKFMNNAKWESYCHFTAGIRRGTDGACHQNIRAHIQGVKPMSKEKLTQITNDANARQIDIDNAEKQFSNVYSVNWAQQHIGETLKGKIYKIRFSSAEEEFEDRIIVVVKNPEKGVYAEIPLSQIVGNRAAECNITRQGCAVCDAKGNIILQIGKNIDFVIEKVDTLCLNIIGRTNRDLVNAPSAREEAWKKRHHVTPNGFIDTKKQRVKRFETKKSHSQQTKISHKEKEKYDY